ncbi:MAG: DUF1611 domain-containing protein [Verrucomicrobiota bacterium]|nr:DUF1611 domain-containing protein [Verrucomicrobiota bacterium]MDP7048626.1 DUF1611 domain-containing protein [Verrucomicrobiota bacterium]
MHGQATGWRSAGKWKLGILLCRREPFATIRRRMGRKILILTEGLSSPHAAKTACGVIRYRRDEVVGVLDTTVPPQPAQALLEVGGDLPVVNSLDALPEANMLLIGIAPSGGSLPAPMRALVLGAIQRGMDVESGLHEFLNDDAELATAAAASGSTLRDLRRNHERDVAKRQGLSADCLRIHTVGHDCSVGKMVVSVEVARGLAKRGVDAKFIATGQTGMMIEGDGCPVDAVVVDFVSGAVEKQILAHQHNDVLVIEGQGSITHPCYSAVTLGLLHGCLPDGLIYCYEMGRKMAKGAATVALPTINSQRELYLAMANAAHPCRFIGVAINSRTVDEAAYLAERDRIQTEWNLPACDVFRENAVPLVNAAIKMVKE